MSLLRLIRTTSRLRIATTATAVVLLAATLMDLIWYEVRGGLPLSKPVHYFALIAGATALLLSEGHRRLDKLDARVSAVEEEVRSQEVRTDLESLISLIDR